MKKLIFLLLLFCAGISARIFSQSWSQGFENVDSLFSAGWAQLNNSEPPGTGLWRKDNGNFTAQNGSVNSSIICDYTSIGGSGVGNISNWLFTPVQTFEFGDTLFFWTRSYANLYYPDRLEVRISNQGPSTDVGTDQFSVGVYSDLLLSINPTLDTSLSNGYPLNWKRFAVPIPSSYHGQSGRIAFRYFVTNGGTNGINGSTIGIDNMHYKWVGEVIAVEQRPNIWWQVFPNPSTGLVSVTVDQPFVYNLFALDGKKYYEGKLEPGINILNLNNLNAGTYIMQILLPENNRTLIRKIQVY
ncbi:MAG: choice-of-anchor J domain-containing protein [Flavobacteriales bacterium]|nr:choice-of-anchor J domain-containing protein [Flavobacteriales bacterium]